MPWGRRRGPFGLFLLFLLIPPLVLAQSGGGLVPYNPFGLTAVHLWGRRALTRFLCAPTCPGYFAEDFPTLNWVDLEFRAGCANRERYL